MPEKPLKENIGLMIQRKRRNRGIREVATEIGISSATLSRIENGKLPDLNTFKKICRWLNIDPSDVLGFPSEKQNVPLGTELKFSVHFKADRNLSSEAASALAKMIIATQKNFSNLAC
jgi:transcriptional regulator with XRE-family HTH domain